MEEDVQLSDSASDSEEEISWIEWFVSEKGNEPFCEVQEEYIMDNFNLTGLNKQVEHYDFALKIILDQDISHLNLTEKQQAKIENSAETLYGLIHARFILTPRGMSLMYQKYKKAEFGKCPRVYCEGEHLLPCGQTDEMQMHSLKYYCNRCKEIYNPRRRNIDGAFFGTTFCHLFFMYYPNASPPREYVKYVPRIFGYKIHPSSQQRIEEEKMKIRKYQAAIMKINANNNSGSSNNNGSTTSTTATTPNDVPTTPSANTSTANNAETEQ